MFLMNKMNKIPFFSEVICSISGFLHTEKRKDNPKCTPKVNDTKSCMTLLNSNWMICTRCSTQNLLSTGNFHFFKATMLLSLFLFAKQLPKARLMQGHNAKTTLPVT